MLMKLKVIIIEKYRTQSRFAVCCGKNDQWITRIITGRQKPTDADKEIFKRKLGIQNIDEYLEKNTDSF